MTHSKNLGSYTDVARILDAVVAAGKPARYELETHGEAVRWRARAYRYRSLLQAKGHERALDIPGYIPTTPYDDIIISFEGPTPAHREQSRALLIAFAAPTGRLTTMDGQRIRTHAPPLAVDDLSLEAADLAKELDLEP